MGACGRKRDVFHQLLTIYISLSPKFSKVTVSLYYKPMCIGVDASKEKEIFESFHFSESFQFICFCEKFFGCCVYGKLQVQFCVKSTLNIYNPWNVCSPHFMQPMESMHIISIASERTNSFAHCLWRELSWSSGVSDVRKSWCWYSWQGRLDFIMFFWWNVKFNLFKAYYYCWILQSTIIPPPPPPFFCWHKHCPLSFIKFLLTTFSFLNFLPCPHICYIRG